ncbi:MAG: DUF2339 domain-containing protein [Lentisphaeria bacterium]|nr:DUF2339 domain-containing protein [Lentisphaeria bacterium]
MKELNFCVICVLAVLLCFLFEKLNRLEKLLRRMTEGKDKEKTQEPRSFRLFTGEKETEAPALPAETPQKAETPALPAETPQTAAPEKKTPLPPSRYDEMWKRFRYWFCFGVQREDVSREYAAATTWLIRGGIAILLCAAGFFLKYSIENNLVNPTVRIIMTFAAAAGMFAAGTAGLNKRFHVLAVGVLAVGIVTFYMGSFAGFKMYRLLPAAAAFSIMVLTTAVAMLTAVKFDLFPVALIACAGGYGTPVMLSEKSGDLPFLTAYVAVISAGLLICARKRVWRGLEWTAFLMSFGLIGAGCARLTNKIDFFCIGCLLANFLVFSLIGVIRPKEAVYGVTEWLLPVLSAALTLLFGIGMIHSCAQESDRGLISAGFAVLLAAVTLAEGVYLARKRPGGAGLLSAFLSASVVSLAVSLPLALESEEAVSAGWSVLAAVLIFAHTRSRLRTLLVLGELAFSAALIYMVCAQEPDGLFGGTAAERFFLGGVFSLALLGAGFILRKTPTDSLGEQAKKIFLAVGGFSMLIYTSVEIFRLLESTEALRDFRHGGVSVWWALAAVLLLAGGIRRNCRALRTAGMLLFTACVIKICAVDISGLNTLHKVAAFLLTGILFFGGATAYILCRRRFQEAGE